MATALRALLLRRGAAAAAPPSPAQLRPLLSPGGRYTTPRSPLLAAAAAAAAGGLPDLRRRPQLSPAPVPPLLLRYFPSKPSKGCAAPPRRQSRTSSNKGKGTPRLEQGCTSPPSRQPPSTSSGEPELEQAEEFMIGLLEDLKKVKKQYAILGEALDNCNKATTLLSRKWNDKNVAMLENGLEKAFKALVVYEKSLDDLSGALSSDALPTDILQQIPKNVLQQVQMFHKESTDETKGIRQELNNALAVFMTLNMRKKVLGVGLSTSRLILKKLNQLSNFKATTAVASGMFLGLLVMIIVRFLE